MKMAMTRSGNKETEKGGGAKIEARQSLKNWELNHIYIYIRYHTQAVRNS